MRIDAFSVIILIFFYLILSGCSSSAESGKEGSSRGKYSQNSEIENDDNDDDDDDDDKNDDDKNDDDKNDDDKNDDDVDSGSEGQDKETEIITYTADSGKEALKKLITGWTEEQAHLLAGCFKAGSVYRAGACVSKGDLVQFAITEEAKNKIAAGDLEDFYSEGSRQFFIDCKATGGEWDGAKCNCPAGTESNQAQLLCREPCGDDEIYDDNSKQCEKLSCPSGESAFRGQCYVSEKAACLKEGKEYFRFDSQNQCETSQIRAASRLCITTMGEYDFSTQTCTCSIDSKVFDAEKGCSNSLVVDYQIYSLQNIGSRQYLHFESSTQTTTKCELKQDGSGEKELLQKEEVVLEFILKSKSPATDQTGYFVAYYPSQRADDFSLVSLSKKAGSGQFAFSIKEFREIKNECDDDPENDAEVVEMRSEPQAVSITLNSNALWTAVQTGVDVYLLKSSAHDGKCLDYDSNKLTVNECNQSDSSQKWRFARHEIPEPPPPEDLPPKES